MRWCGLIITDRHGNPLSLLHAMWRTFAHFLTYLTLGLGFFAMNFNRRKLALHDWISGTEVRKYDAEFEAERKRRTEAAKAEALTRMALAKSTPPKNAGKPHPPAGKPMKRPNPVKTRRPQAKRPTNPQNNRGD